MDHIESYLAKVHQFIKENNVPKDIEEAEPKKERKKPKKKLHQIFFMNK